MARRKLLLFVLATSCSVLVPLAVASCSSTESTGNQLPVRDEDSGTKKRDATNTDPPADGSDPPLPDGGKPPGRVYAHTRDTLFLFEPYSRKITEIGKFDCVPTGGVGADNDSVLDIALDRTGAMYGTTYYRFISIDPVTAKCTEIKKETTANLYPNSLSFVPMGTVDPTTEALVGYAYDNLNDATIYTRINLQTGEMTDMLNLNPPGQDPEYGTSGDLIGLLRNGNKGYVIIKQVTGDAGASNDQLAEFDPSTGRLKTILGDIGVKQLYGFAYWAGKGYGFGADGRVHEIDMANGKSTVVATIPDGGSWYGAGVTTDSPTAP